MIITTLQGEAVMAPKVRRALTVATQEFIESKRKQKRGEVKPKPPTIENISSEKEEDLEENRKENLEKPKEEIEEYLMGNHRLEMLKVNPYLMEILEHQVVSPEFRKIKELLKEVCSENPLDVNLKKGNLTAKLELKDPNKNIRVKPMQYTPEDSRIWQAN